MDLHYRKIKEIFPLFNERALTEEDFWREAERNRIYVREELLMVDGYYEKKNRRHFIVINIKLRGVRWLHTALHELMHFYFDTNRADLDEEITLCRSRIQQFEKRERIADALALIGVLPFPELENLMHEDLSEFPYLCELVRDRIAVLIEMKR